MDWVDVRDIAQANLLAANSNEPIGVYNVGTGRETSLLELGRLLLKIAGVGGEPQLSADAPQNPIPRRVADISMAQHKLKYAPTISLEQGLRDMIAWWHSLGMPSKDPHK